MKNLTRLTLLAVFAFSLNLADSNRAAAQQWTTPIIARGSYRAYLQSLPIEARPNRPFHFYGNTVRRRHQGDVLLPTIGTFPHHHQRLPQTVLPIHASHHHTW